MTTEEFNQLAARTEKRPLIGASVNLSGEQFRVMHAALGVAGEAGELVDAVKRFIIYNKPLDTTNIIEEVGDILWYIAILCNEYGFTIEHAMESCIAKLKQRYPNQYTDEDALARADKQHTAG